MKNFHVNTDSTLLDKIADVNVKEFKNLVKIILTSDDFHSDSSTICLLADIKTALGMYPKEKDLRILTKKQKTVIIEHILHGKTQEELAYELNITQQGVSILLKTALKRIKEYILNSGNLNWIHWTAKEKSHLMSRYGKTNIYNLSKELNKSISRVVSMYHFLHNKEKQWLVYCKQD